MTDSSLNKKEFPAAKKEKKRDLKKVRNLDHNEGDTRPQNFPISKDKCQK